MRDRSRLAIMGLSPGKSKGTHPEAPPGAPTLADEPQNFRTVARVGDVVEGIMPAPVEEQGDHPVADLDRQQRVLQVGDRLQNDEEKRTDE